MAVRSNGYNGRQTLEVWDTDIARKFFQKVLQGLSADKSGLVLVDFLMCLKGNPALMRKEEGVMRKEGMSKMSGLLIPFWERYTLSIEEAAVYFRIGEKKLRQLTLDNPTADFILMNGNRVQIKRKLFEQYIDSATAV